jgi:hypothetical protein
MNQFFRIHGWTLIQESTKLDEGQTLVTLCDGIFSKSYMVSELSKFLDAYRKSQLDYVSKIHASKIIIIACDFATTKNPKLSRMYVMDTKNGKVMLVN